MLKSKALYSLALLAALIIVDPSTVPAQGPPEQPDLTIDAATRQEVVHSLLKRLSDSYVFPDVAEKMAAAVRERAGRGEYDQLTSARAFAEKLTSDLQAVSRDKHLRVRYSHQAIPERGQRREPSAEELAEQQKYLSRINYGFERIERLPGNVGYMDFRGFTDEKGGAETVAAAFNFLANTDALIIDMRKNGGGNPAMVALICSYLFGTEPVHLNSLYWREGNRTDEFWTLKEVAGKRYMGKDVYVLTSNYTFSGAEEFTYNLKNLKRATVIGETTGGGAHPGGFNRVHAHFGAFIPTGRAINPITKTNWEGTGVEPDVKVPADQALKVAHLASVKKAIDKTTDEELKGALRRLADNLQTEIGQMQGKAAPQSSAAGGQK